MNLKEFKNELRILLPSDEWLVSLDAWFECAGYLWNRDLDIPYEWHYSPGTAYDPTEEDNYFHDLFKGCSDKELYDIGNFLFRYCQYLEYRGLDY